MLRERWNRRDGFPYRLYCILIHGTLWHQISEVEAKAHKARGEDTIFDILESSRHAEGSALCRQMAWAESSARRHSIHLRRSPS